MFHTLPIKNSFIIEKSPAKLFQSKTHQHMFGALNRLKANERNLHR